MSERNHRINRMQNTNALKAELADVRARMQGYLEELGA